MHQFSLINLESYNHENFNNVNIDGYKIIESKKALFERSETKISGKATDWIVSPASGDIKCTGGENAMLWLMHDGLEASTRFEKPSSAVAFLIHGDHNDGFADFYVNNLHIGTIDMHESNYKALVINNLNEEKPHTLMVKVSGKQNKKSKGTHVHICAGFALKPSGQ
ncbi:MAG: hypothetical protein V4525_15980 [Pseudomonadota bacterium]